MTVTEAIAALRRRMQEERIDAYYIPTNDYHNSEYVGDYFKTREFISGFTGSAGNVIVTMEEAGLWTDGRYFLQAQEQLRGSGITLYRSGMEGVPNVQQYLQKTLRSGQVLGCDGRTVTAAWAKAMRSFVTLRCDLDLVGDIWEERPQRSAEPIWLLEECYAGESRESKMSRIRDWMKRCQFDQYILTALDDIAWLLNIRGNDIPCNPVVLSYLVIGPEDAVLFCKESAVSKEVREALLQIQVRVMDYEEIETYVSHLNSKHRIALDKRVVNQRIAESVPRQEQIADVMNPIEIWKAIKNETEIRNEREAHIRDGVAVTRFIYWLKKNISILPITEISAAERLEEFRKEGEDYLEPSFEPIAGYGPHGAIVHYSATPDTDVPLQPEGFLLLDTGGQYLQGTTDITRTILLGGMATEEEKRYYTAVLRGNLNLAAAKFKEGCSGVALDYLARAPLWEMGCDYEHGTGHGVGYLLNVHEAPNAFRYRIVNHPGANVPLQVGMITSDEPGIYLEGRFGIRLENLILCVAREKNEYGQFMGFEPLTFVPFDREAIDPEQMSARERELLNEYHRQVYEKISPFLDRQEKEWLMDECAPL